MTHKFFFLVLLFLSVFFLSAETCKNKKKPGSANTSSSPTQTVAIAPTTTVSAAEGTVRFVVSFYSIGEGIDEKVHSAFVNFMDSYPKKISYEPIHWGREGETDYCLLLKELLADEQKVFIQKAKELLAKSSLVHISENAKCEHTGWPKIQIQDKPQEEKCRLVVSFYSIGAGIDLGTHAAFEKFLGAYPKKISYELTHWGREGEMDYCLKLDGLSASEQDEFVKKAKELLVKSKLVHIHENEK